MTDVASSRMICVYNIGAAVFCAYAASVPPFDILAAFCALLSVVNLGLAAINYRSGWPS